MDSGLDRTVREHVCIGLGRVFDCNGLGRGLGRGAPAVGTKHWD
jgi:hypothetical protein